MTAFASRWLDWQPSNSTEDGAHAGNDGVRSPAPSTYETPIQQTDKTDKRASVSFVSASSKRFQPETGGDAGGAAEHDGGLAPAEAEARAFECAVVQWMNRNPPADADEDHCAACGGPLGRIGEDAVAVLAGEGRHAWVHHSCHHNFMAQRRDAAVTALAAMGFDGGEAT